MKAYPDDPTIQTTLVEGSISIVNINSRGKERETYLTPNQTAVYYKSEEGLPEKDIVAGAQIKSVSPQTVHIENKINTILYTSWKDKKWVIEGEPWRSGHGA